MHCIIATLLSWTLDSICPTDIFYSRSHFASIFMCFSPILEENSVYSKDTNRKIRNTAINGSLIGSKPGSSSTNPSYLIPNKFSSSQKNLQHCPRLCSWLLLAAAVTSAFNQNKTTKHASKMLSKAQL